MEHKTLTPIQKIISELKIVLFHLEYDVRDEEYDHNSCHACAIGHMIRKGLYVGFDEGLEHFYDLYADAGLGEDAVHHMFRYTRSDRSRICSINTIKQEISRLEILNAKD